MLDFEINIIILYIYLNIMIFFHHKFTFHHSRINENLAIEPAIKSEKIEDNDKMILDKVLKISWLNANKAKK